MAEQTASPSVRADRSRQALELVHSLLVSSAAERLGLAGLLETLARSFEVSSAGLASLPGGTLLACFPTPGTATAAPGFPGQNNAELLDSLRQARAALVVSRPEGGTGLLTSLCGCEGQSWLLWVEDAQRREWSDGEKAALFLAGQVILRCLSQQAARPRWAAQLERLQRQQRLDQAALVVRRLAHDFGNVLTGILGFTELALSQPLPAGAPLQGYLNEAHHSIQAGAQLTQQLRQLGRRMAGCPEPCSLAAVVAEEAKRLRTAPDAPFRLEVSVPDNLPALAMSAEPLRQVLAVLLDNAREAIPAPPSLAVRSATMPIAPSRALTSEIKVSARSVEVSADLAGDFYGEVQPGLHVEITITDSGCGLSPDGWQRLFQEPFYSTKPRRRGFGLALAYGILASNKSGLLLAPAEKGGTLARVLVPAHLQAPTRETRAAGSGDRILVVDDDPMILQFVSTTLKRAGFQVQAVGSAEEALQAYFDARTGDPFQLVLADVLMPNIGGIDLARRLLARDPAVRILFMSGQATQDIALSEIDGQRFEVLSKPFRPEGLLRAVRSTLGPASAPA